MHAEPDLPDLGRLPPDLRDMVERQMAALAAERAARLHLESENKELKAHNTRLQHLVRELERARYGRRSEKLDPDQLSLALEDIETAIGAALAAEEARMAAQSRRKLPARPGSRTSGGDPPGSCSPTLPAAAAPMPSRSSKASTASCRSTGTRATGGSPILGAGAIVRSSSPIAGRMPDAK